LIRAQFETVFRGETLTVELIASVLAGRTTLTAEFWKDGKPHHVEALTRKELAILCREAAAYKRESQ
jgi:hypothetical protein